MEKIIYDEIIIKKIKKSKYSRIIDKFSNVDEFIILIYTYSYYMNLILEKDFNLSYYDNYIKNNELSYKSVEKENLDFYQFLFSNNYNYIYLRNTFHVNRLSKEQKEFLLSCYYNNEELNVNIEKFIKETLPIIIIENEMISKEKLVSYDDENDRGYLSKNLSLVIGIKYDNFFENPNENFVENNTKRKNRIDIISDLMEIEFNKDMTKTNNINVKVFVYKNIKKDYKNYSL